MNYPLVNEKGVVTSYYIEGFTLVPPHMHTESKIILLQRLGQKSAQKMVFVMYRNSTGSKVKC